MGQIKVLSKEISELIAAGEVIERPSSVIKELVENSIDADATAITVEIKNGGRTYMRISDNGKGMSTEDVSLAFVRHATSKISTQDDLNSIFTLGFRGEALASISAVSKTDVLTKRADDEYGTHYSIEGSVEKVCESAGCPDGTTIIIRDLFYNVPARLKFLKKDVTESNNISAIVSRLALSHPEISFKLIKDNKTELVTSGDGKLYSAIYSVFGREFANTLLPVSYKMNSLEVEGYISNPLNSRANRSMQNFFINNRYVKSITCMVALEEAYKNSIMTGKFPACVLNIKLSPSFVDVNVHPAKTEIRFSDEKLIYELMYFAVKNALLANDKPQQMTLETKKPVISQSTLYQVPMDEVSKNQTVMTFKPQQNQPSLSTVKSEDRYESVISAPEKKESEVITKNNAAESPKAVYTPEVKKAVMVTEAVKPKIEDTQLKEFKYINQQSFVKKEEADEPIGVIEEKIEPKPQLTVIGEVFSTYIVVECGEDMYLIDKHATHERILFEKLKKEESLTAQMLLVPETVLMSFEEYDVLINNAHKLNDFGFIIKPDVAPNVIVEALPGALVDVEISEMLAELAENLKDCKENPMVSHQDELFHSIACRAAVKAHDKSTSAELEELARTAIFDDTIRYCPHGRPVLIKLSKREIEKQFKRIV